MMRSERGDEAGGEGNDEVGVRRRGRRNIALNVAARDYAKELRARRDGIVERLYAVGLGVADRCRNCGLGATVDGLSRGRVERNGSSSPAAEKRLASTSPPSMNGEVKEEEEREVEDDDHPISF